MTVPTGKFEKTTPRELGDNIFAEETFRKGAVHVSLLSEETMLKVWPYDPTDLPWFVEVDIEDGGAGALFFRTKREAFIAAGFIETGGEND